LTLRGDRIREKREERGLTQRELARLCGFGINQITRYEIGLSQPTAEHLKIISEQLGVSADYLLGLTTNERGQLGDTTLSEQERDVLEVLRHEGWLGLIRFCTERMAKSS
jgi:transcriptional regulator with XRE-family HTH domain